MEYGSNSEVNQGFRVSMREEYGIMLHNVGPKK